MTEAVKITTPDPTAEPRQERFQKNIMKPRSNSARREPSEFEERVIEVRRVARTVKGGRRIRFRALVVIGNRKGKVGMGMAKATDVAEAVKKAVTQAKKNLIEVPVINGTIPYDVISKHGAAVVMLKPAAEGTSIVAGGAVRAIAELAGITDLLSKMMGSPSKVNNIVATMKAFTSFKPEYTAKIQGYADKKIEAPKVDAEVEVKSEKLKVESVAEEKKVAKAKPAPKTDAKKAAKKKMK